MISREDYNNLSYYISKLKDTIDDLDSELDDVDITDSDNESDYETVWYNSNWEIFVKSVLQHLPANASLGDAMELEDLLNNFVKGR